MPGPFAEGSIVVEIETGEPERCLRFDPGAVDGQRWLHRLDRFDEVDAETAVERYALPAAEAYDVEVVEVPPGERLQVGTLAPLNGREGGADLVELSSRDAPPESWVVERTTLTSLLG